MYARPTGPDWWACSRHGKYGEPPKDPTDIKSNLKIISLGRKVSSYVKQTRVKQVGCFSF
jgi:hypothetical protein